MLPRFVDGGQVLDDAPSCAPCRIAPRDSVTETTIGSSSGVRPTASAIANRNDSSQGRPCQAFTSSTNSTMNSVSRMIRRPNARVPLLERGRRRLALERGADRPSRPRAGRDDDGRPVPLTTEVP